MEYRYFEDDNFEDYSSGRVIYQKAGMPNFPVRLAGEIFRRCLEYTGKKNIVLYDPCCGGAYMMTVLGLLHGKTIKTVVASDINEEAVRLARKNLSLLSEEGLNIRKKQIEEMQAEYKKQSHTAALASVNSFLETVESNSSGTGVKVFTADVLTPGALINKGFTADMVITDVPYGNLVSWSENSGGAMNTFLENLVPVLSKAAVVAVVSDKSQKVAHDNYRRLEKFKAGKRQVTILRNDEK